MSECPRGKIIEGVTTPLEPWLSKHWSPWTSKKIADYWQAYLTHKIVREILEPDSRALAILFYWLTPAKIFSLGHSTHNLDAALLSTCLSPRQPQRRAGGTMGTRRCKLLQRRTHPATEIGVDFGTTVRTFGYPPTVYWPMSALRNDLSQIRNAACSLGLFGLWMDDSVWGDGSQQFCFGNGDRYLLSTAFMQVTFWLIFNNLNTQLGFFK